MTFLNFLQLPESVFRPNFQENTFLETKLNFSLTGKCFPLTNFSNGKQTQESLESDFPESEFRETNIARRTSMQDVAFMEFDRHPAFLPDDFLTNVAPHFQIQGHHKPS
jgi:hypothetical protein